MDIDYLYFDLGQVLVRFSYDIGARNLARLTGADPIDILQQTYLGPLQTKFESGQIDVAEYAEQLNHFLHSQLTTDQILEATSAIFWPNLSILPLIGSLHSAGYSLGVLSNTCSAHWHYVINRYPFLQSLFRNRVLSYEVGAMKPDPRIYQVAIQLAHTDPNRIFFVDDRQENVDGAAALGMRSTLFISPIQVANVLRQLGLRFNY